MTDIKKVGNDIMKRHQLLTCAALVLSIIALAYSTFAPARTAAASPAFTTATAVPLYRFLQPGTASKTKSVSGNYLYTADPNERSVLIGQGWIEQQQEGYVFRQQVPGTVPLFRVVSGESFNLHFDYTINPAEVDKATSEGWKMQGPACFVSPTKVAGTAPLFRLAWHPKDIPGGPPPTQGTIDLFQFYTIDEKQKYEAIYSDYQLIRSEGYVWTQPVTLDTITKPVAPALLPESYYTDALFNLGCAKAQGGGITCPSEQGYFSCEYYRKQGNIKATSCLANFDLASFNKIEANLVDLGCKRFLGRPGEYRCESWAGGEACAAAFMSHSSLITKCYSPVSDLASSYRDSFGRMPTAKEIDYWSGEMKMKKLSYKDVMTVHSQWVKSSAAEAERKGVANRSVYEAFGRYPSTEEVNNIAGIIESKGTSYADLVKGHVAWMTGDGPQQDQALREMIGRAFSNAKKPQPGQAQYNEWMTKVKAQKLTFNQVVALLKK